MIKFEKVSRFKDVDFAMPVRKTKHSAGYDMVVAEDFIVPPYKELYESFNDCIMGYVTLGWLETETKRKKLRPSLVSTGVKCYLDPGYYLELSVRSSTPLKYWLVMANSQGIIDGDYADNENNEGEIFFQLINLSPYPILLKRGDVIGQGIIKKYNLTDDDCADGERVGGFGSTNG